MVEHEPAHQQTEPGQPQEPTTKASDGELSDEQLDQVASGAATRDSPDSDYPLLRVADIDALD
jgi:hypothetical protein